ncbi:tandem-95 repeat protein [Humisphaera borealis]|uniref:Tandem-95 repeat protein n=1 Tax=Humisphaera borealis TaxID=2807512 RepID=A0A7M2WVM9_9BACT|nr:Ig-like domain-containing protein [Humisphaera borealis]QOV89384.1 tandem-95 repeat protein [Humisphaera borealis]
MTRPIPSVSKSSKIEPRKLIRRAARRALPPCLGVELLEGRALLSGDVAGTVYDDVNNDGIKNNGENGLPGWTVFVDVNRNGGLDAGEPAGVTNKDGDYLITSTYLGVRSIREIVPAGWTPSAGTASSKDTLIEDGKEAKVDFFNFRAHVGSIVGSVWQDMNGDGIRATDATTGLFTDPGLPGWTIFIDNNRNLLPDAGEPSTLTDANGQYTFTNFAPGDYEVTQVLPAGWEVSKTHDVQQTVRVVDGGTTTASDFANISLINGSIQGTVWNDLNGDGVRATDPTTGGFSEPGLEGWTVYLDLNNNRAADAGEPTATTNASGVYLFTGLDAGDYEVTEVLPAGWNTSPTFDLRQTVAVSGGLLSTARDFANFGNSNGSIRGSAWNDLNADGLRGGAEPALVGWTIYLDLNGNGAKDAAEPTALTDATGTYRFSGLQVGEYDVVELLPAGWETSPGFAGDYAVKVFGGTESVAPDFANYAISAVLPGTVSGTLWEDINGNGIREFDLVTSSFADPGVSGWTVFIDSNSNRVLDAAELSATSGADGSYRISGVAPGSVSVVVQLPSGWRSSAPVTNVRTISLRNGQDVTAQDFGSARLRESSISGTVYADANKSGTRDAGERGLAGMTVYLDTNDNGNLDAGEPRAVTSTDLFFTPSIDEAGTYSFTHLAGGTHVVRSILPATLSATPTGELRHAVTITGAENRTGVDTAAVFRANEIRGVRFDDRNDDGVKDAGEPGVAGVTVFVDLDRDDTLDAGEPTAVTKVDGSYVFTDLTPGAYVVREVLSGGNKRTFPRTTGGILWPTGVSNPAVGNVSPGSINISLAKGQKHRQTVSLTLPNTGALTNLVDVFLLFDDTGSFVNNSPIVRAAFPTIISQLQTAMPGIDLGFGVGRLEEYGNFASEYGTGRPFTLNQPIVAASSAGYMTAIQAALNRTTPGYGGDQPETDIEALYQLVTGKGFDGNNNGSVLDSGPAGLASTQLSPGLSGDVPSFASFVADPANSVMAAAGNVGGGGFRAGALPIILTATDTGFAYQPKGESTITGVGGVSLPISALTQTSRPTTPFNSGAGLQETVTGLNALGALVIGLGTNPQATLDPRQGLESLSKLTGAVNRSTATIDNGTADPIAPGDPLYFQIASGFAGSVANGVVNAIQNAVTNVAVDLTVQASDPRVRITNYTGTLTGIGAGQTATFDVEFIGDGAPRRLDLQFVRAGTNVVMGSIPVVIGTPIPGDGYEYCELEDGEFEDSIDFGASTSAVAVNSAPSFVKGADQNVLEDAASQIVSGWATAISAGPASEAGQVLDFIVTNDNNALFSVQPTVSADGTLSYTPAANASGSAVVTVSLHDNGGTVGGGIDISLPQTFIVNIAAVNDAPTAGNDSYSTSEDTTLTVTPPGVLSNDSDIEGSALTVTLVDAPTHGTVSLNTDGSFSYTPAENYNGPDSFTYRASDGTASSNLATVTLSIAAVNDAPVAADDVYATAEDQPLNISAPGLLSNDSDADGDPLTAGIVTGPVHGTITLNADGSFTYTPAANYNGPDSFTYRASDGTVSSNLATVTLGVTAVNDAPVAADDVYTTAEDQPLNISAPGLLSNDSDADGDPLTAGIVTGPAHGTVSLNADGSFTYTPAANYNGPDSFTYRASDGTLSSSAATVSLTVSAVNDTPVAGNDAYSVAQGATLTVSAPGLLGNDSDTDGDLLNAVQVTGPAHGTLVLNASGSFVYTPSAGYSGTDSFTYSAIDGTAASAAATVTIVVTPVVVPGGTKFYVVDGTTTDTFGYDAAGAATTRKSLNKENADPRGIAAKADGTRLWTIDEKGDVFVYTPAGKLLGSWTAKGLGRPEGITTDGVSLWVVDNDSDKVFYFAGAAARLSGKVSATSSFSLNRSNRDAMDVVTDGSHLWVVNDGSKLDSVFRYSMLGLLEGNWTIDSANRTPTGLTLDPNDVSDLWIVDAGTDRVYEYAGATARLSGSQSASATFQLATANRNAQGIADPRPSVAASIGEAASEKVELPPVRPAAKHGSAKVEAPASPVFAQTLIRPQSSLKDAGDTDGSDDLLAVWDHERWGLN